MKPINQTLLTFIIAMMMILGFVGVYGIGYQYTQNANPELIFESDSNLEYGALDYAPYFELNGYTSPGLLQPMHYYRNLQTSVLISNNFTMIYIGNNTWDGANPGLGTGTYADSLTYINPLLPFVKSNLITSINLKMNLPGDADILVQSYIASHNNPILPLTDAEFQVDIQDVTNYDGETSYNETFTIKPYQALKMYSDANQNPYTYWAIEIYDSAHNGMTPYNVNLSFEFYGTPVTTWSLQDSINVVIGGSMIGNFVIGIFMLDFVDFRGTSKTLPGKSAWKPKRKTRKTGRR